MGWTSTGDPYANVGDSALSFDSEEAAKSFAERHGWNYVVCCSLHGYNLVFSDDIHILWECYGSVSKAVVVYIDSSTEKRMFAYGRSRSLKHRYWRLVTNLLANATCETNRALLSGGVWA